MTGKNEQWADLTTRIVKAEMARTGVKNLELARRLTEMGLPDTEPSVHAKIARGAFPAWWLFAVMRALGSGSIRLE